jgi:transposase-like protein
MWRVDAEVMGKRSRRRDRENHLTGQRPVDRRQDRLYGGDAAPLGAPRRAGPGPAPGVTTDERARLKALERENRELRQANEILRKASAYFAQAELDRRFKP